MNPTATLSLALPVFVQGLVLSLGLIVAIGAQNAFVLRQGLRREPGENRQAFFLPRSQSRGRFLRRSTNTTNSICTRIGPVSSYLLQSYPVLPYRTPSTQLLILCEFQDVFDRKIKHFAY